MGKNRSFIFNLSLKLLPYMLFIIIRTEKTITIRLKRKTTCQNQHSQYY